MEWVPCFRGPSGVGGALRTLTGPRKHAFSSRHRGRHAFAAPLIHDYPARSGRAAKAWHPAFEGFRGVRERGAQAEEGSRSTTQVTCFANLRALVLLGEGQIRA